MNKFSGKGWIIAGCLLMTLPLQAQEKKDSVQVAKDTTAAGNIENADTIHYGIVTVIQTNRGDTDRSHRITKVEIGHGYKTNKQVTLKWLKLDLGFNNYIDKSAYGTPAVNNFAPVKPGEPPVTSAQFALRPGKSVNVNIWLVTADVNLVQQKLFLKTGLGIEMNNYRYTKNISYTTDYAGTYVIRDSVNFKKNKLFTEYLTVPLMLKYTTGGSDDRSFRVAFGGTFGYLIKDRTKQISSERGKVKNRNDFNLENYRLGLRGELGFGPITLYGSYSLTPIHQYGLKQYPFSIGIVL